MCVVRVKWVVLWSLWAARLVPQPTAPLRAAGGALRGRLAPSGSHAAYTAIPYATVTHRFQAPGPPPTWEGIFNAYDEHIRCQQSSLGDTVMAGRRDCLVLNVYTPLNAQPEDRLPVMVFIHGGGFFQGSGGAFMYGPEYLVPKDIILVTVNYRLNIQGFLCLGIKEAPGNAAMKDQVAALKWVQRNIRAFGGDPDNVTLFGESAGAASVSFHLLSPMSKGLFHKAITQSGSALAPWAYQYKPVYLASLLAKTMLYNSEDPHELYKYLETKSDEELVLTRVPRQRGNIIPSEILYSPCAEKVLDGEEPFLTESPIDILKKGNFNKVPVIIGANTEEGFFLIGMDNDTMIDQIDYHVALPKNLEITSLDKRKEIAEKLKQFYLGGDTKNKVKISKFYGEPILLYSSFEEAEWMVKSSSEPVYTYLFNYSGRRNLPKQISGSPYNRQKNATHADELLYMFSQPILPHVFETTMIEKITTLWTNFAKYSDPTPSTSELLPVRWPPMDPASLTALWIDEEFSLSPMWYTESLRFLREVYSKYRRR